MSESNGSGSSGPSFLSMLAILFIGLKLAGLIDWPWWLVLAPVWGTLAVLLACFLVLGIIAFAENRKG